MSTPRNTLPNLPGVRLSPEPSASLPDNADPIETLRRAMQESPRSADDESRTLVIHGQKVRMPEDGESISPSFVSSHSLNLPPSKLPKTR